MPIYEFRCGHCAEQFEGLFAVGTESANCPACGKTGAPRVYSQFGAIPKYTNTPATNRRLEDKRGTNRDGARTRWKESMRKRRQGREPK